MTLPALVAQARVLPTIRGRLCVRVGVGAGTALLLDFGELSPPDLSGYQEPEYSLVAECDWRLDASESVIVGSGDHRERIRSEVQVLVGLRPLDTAVFLPSYSARVAFEGELTLWIFPTCSEDYAEDAQYPSAPWYLAGRALPIRWEE